MIIISCKGGLTPVILPVMAPSCEYRQRIFSPGFEGGKPACGVYAF